MTESTSTDGAQQEHMKFEAEVNQLLKLMIHSLYSNQEIFLRELVSNASDACDKLRFEAIADNSLLENDNDLRVVVEFDQEAGVVSLTGDQQQDAQLIGQFGVGFYSGFVVADKMVLTTRRAGDSANDAVRWESDGTGGYTLDSTEQAERGTTVELFLKEDAKEFANGWKLRSVIKKYSDHITFPIMMWKDIPPVSEEDADADALSSMDQAKIANYRRRIQSLLSASLSRLRRAIVLVAQ